MAGRRGDCRVGLGPVKVEVMAVFLQSNLGGYCDVDTVILR
jgi:hypothetical protein